MKRILLALYLSFFPLIPSAFAAEKDSHSEEGHNHEAEDDHKHDESEEAGEHAGEGDGHGHEENENIGPGKGIVSASEKVGIQISPEAEKNFEIQKVNVTNPNQLELPKSAIVTAGIEVNLYRFREGHYKRVDFEFISKSDKTVVVKSQDLKSGDQIVVRGMGLLRIAEIAAFGGAPEGHSH